MSAKYCQCCGKRHEGTKRYCAGCIADHGYGLGKRDPLTWEPLCTLWRAESAARTERMRTMAPSMPPRRASAEAVSETALIEQRGGGLRVSE